VNWGLVLEWLPAAAAWAGVLAVLVVTARVRATQRNTARELQRMDLLWRQIRGIEQLDDTERTELARSLYAQFDPHGLPWDDLGEDVRDLWRHQAMRVAAEVTALFVVHARRESQA